MPALRISLSVTAMCLGGTDLCTQQLSSAHLVLSVVSAAVVLQAQHPTSCGRVVVADCGFHDSNSWLNATSVYHLGASFSAVACSFTNHVTGPSVRFGLMCLENCTFANNSDFDWGLYGEGFVDPAASARLRIDPPERASKNNPLPLDRSPSPLRMQRITDADFAALRQVLLSAFRVSAGNAQSSALICLVAAGWRQCICW